MEDLRKEALVRKYAQLWRRNVMKKLGKLPAQALNPFRSNKEASAFSFLDFLQSQASKSADQRPMPTIQGYLERAFGGAFKSFKRRLVRIGLDPDKKRLEIIRDDAKVVKVEKAYIMDAAVVSDVASNKYKGHPLVVSVTFAQGNEKVYLAFEGIEEKRNWFRVLKLYSKQGNLTHPLIDISEEEITEFACADMDPLADDTQFVAPDDASLISPTSQYSMSSNNVPFSPGPPSNTSQVQNKETKQLGKASATPEEIVRNYHSEFWSVFDRPESSFRDSVSKGLELNEIMGAFVAYATRLCEMLVDQLCVPETAREFPRYMTAFPGESDDSIYDIMDTRTGVVIRFDPGDVLLKSADSLLPYELSSRLMGMEIRSNTAFLHAMKPGTPLRVPLLCLVDFKGHRCMCTAGSPFNPETNMVYGFMEDQTYVSKAEPRYLMRVLCKKINLARHFVFLDPERPTKICTSIETQVFIGQDGKYYLVHAGRCYPPDASYPLVDGGDPSNVSPQRNGLVHTRVLRPELVSSFQNPLSSDAFRNVGGDAPDRVEMNTRVRQASLFLHDVVIANFITCLDDSSTVDEWSLGALGMTASNEKAFSFSPVDVYDGAILTKRMHEAGINMRYLGLIAKRTKLPHIRQIAEIEMISRVLKREHSRLLRELVTVRAAEFYDFGASDFDAQFYGTPQQRVHEELISATVDFFNLVLGNSMETVPYWTDQIVKFVQRKFNYTISKPAEIYTYALFLSLQRQLGVLFVAKASYDFSASFDPVVQSDFVKFVSRVKYMNHGALFVDRLKSKLPYYLQESRFNEALQVYNIALSNVRQMEGLASVDSALLLNDISRVLFLYGFPDVGFSFLRLSLGLLRKCNAHLSLHTILLFCTAGRMHQNIHFLSVDHCISFSLKLVQLCSGFELFPLMIKLYLCIVQGDPANRLGRNFEYLRAALKVSETCLGRNHPVSGMLYEKLGALYLNGGQFISEAVTLFKKSLQIHSDYKAEISKLRGGFSDAHILSGIDLSLDDVYEKFAEALFLSGAKSESISMMERCVKIREEKFGPSHKKTVESLQRLAVVCDVCGDMRKAIACRENLLLVLKLIIQSIQDRQIKVRAYGKAAIKTSDGYVVESDDDVDDAEVEKIVMLMRSPRSPSRQSPGKSVAAMYSPYRRLEQMADPDADLLEPAQEDAAQGTGTQANIAGSNQPAQSRPANAAAVGTDVFRRQNSVLTDEELPEKFRNRLRELDEQRKSILEQVRRETATILKIQVDYLPLDQRAMVESAVSYCEGNPIAASYVKEIMSDLYDTSPSAVLFRTIEKVNLLDNSSSPAGYPANADEDRRFSNPLFSSSSDVRVYPRDAPFWNTYRSDNSFLDTIRPLYEKLAVLFMLGHNLNIKVYRRVQVSDTWNDDGSPTGLDGFPFPGEGAPVDQPDSWRQS
eukprot:ANDGO_03415.mRNA.1 Clustered mitochondria protein homolog